MSCSEQLFSLISQGKITYDQIRRLHHSKYSDLEQSMRLLYDHEIDYGKTKRGRSKQEVIIEDISSDDEPGFTSIFRKKSKSKGRSATKRRPGRPAKNPLGSTPSAKLGNSENVAKTTSGRKRVFKQVESRASVTEGPRLKTTAARAEPSDTTRNISALSENQSEKEATPVFVEEVADEPNEPISSFQDDFFNERPALAPVNQNTPQS